MKTITAVTLMTLSLGYASLGNATTFYLDPVNGSMTGNGSATNPWRTLREVIKEGKISTKDINGASINASAPVKAGDTLILKSGYHGFVQISNAFNDLPITVIAEAGHKPTLSGLELISVKNWKFSNLTISPVFFNSDPTIDTTSTYNRISTILKGVVQIGDSGGTWGNSSQIILTNSHVYTFSEAPETLNDVAWKAKAKEGIYCGKAASSVSILNNYVNNVSFGIDVVCPYSQALGNVVTDFSKDGMRATASNIIVADNVIKNNYVIDNNHPDGIQGFSSDVTLPLTNVDITGNLILNRDKKESPTAVALPLTDYSGGMQGVGFFDGPFYGIHVKNNVVMTFLWQGIALFSSTNGEVMNNIAFTPSQITDKSALISLRATHSNTIFFDNQAIKYEVSPTNNTGILINTNNTLISKTNESLFMARITNRLAEINAIYGQSHPVANKPRIEESFMSGGIASIF